MHTSTYATFLATIEAGSLTQAAENLGCTQSAVSHSIASLEAELGFPLITRSRGGVRLTQEGLRIRRLTSGMSHPKYSLRSNTCFIERCSSVRNRVLVCFC